MGQGGRDSRRSAQFNTAKEARKAREHDRRQSASRFFERTTKAPGGEDGSQKSKARKVAAGTAYPPAYDTAAGPTKFDDDDEVVDPDL